jgi:hypothetical protein
LIDCAVPQKEIIQDQGLLSAAGLSVLRADDAGKRRNLEILPVHRLVTETQEGAVDYVYADPPICRCIYFGDEEAYREYRRLVLDRRLSDQRAMEAKPDQRVTLDWGTWGAGLVAGIIGFCNWARKTDD